MKKGFKTLLTGGLAAVMVLGGGISAFAETEVPAEEVPAEEATAEETVDSNGSYTIAVIPKLEGITFFTVVQEGAERAGEELGVQVIYKGPDTASTEEQVALIEDFVKQGVDAICVSPNDMAAVGAALMEAEEAGIMVMDWDSQCGEAVTSASIYNVVDKDFGEHMVDKLVEFMGEEGDYAIITGGEDAQNLNSWIDAGRKYAETAYPGLNLVTVPIPSNEVEDEAYSITLDLLNSYPDLKGILGYSTPTAPGCARAIRELGKQDEVALVANGVESDCLEYREDGSLDCGCLWDCEGLGYLTVATAKYILDGNTLDDSFRVEGLDEMSVSENGHNVYYTHIGNDF